MANKRRRTVEEYQAWESSRSQTRLTLRLTEEQKGALTDEAQRVGLSVSAFVVEMLEERLRGR